MLFAVPFGPKAMAETAGEAQREDATAVFGVSADEVERLRILLAQAAGDGRGRRVELGTGYAAFGTLAAAAGGWLATKGPSLAAYGLLVDGGITAGLGILQLARTSDEEDLYRVYATAAASPVPADRAAAVAWAERALFGLRDHARHKRAVSRVWSFVLIGLGVSGFVVNEIAASASTPRLSSDVAWEGRLTFGSFFALGATFAVSSFVPEPIERVAEVWESDPGRVRARAPVTRPQVSFAPAPGGGRLQLGWSF